MELKKLIDRARREGVSLFIVRLGEDPQVATTEPLSQLGNVFAEALAVAVRALTATTKYTTEQVLDSLVTASVAGAKRRLALTEQKKVRSA